MIDSKELTRGSHVLYGDDMVEVVDVSHLNDKPIIIVDWASQRTVAMPQSIKPIPITIDLLLELGFETYSYDDVDEFEPLKCEKRLGDYYLTGYKYDDDSDWNFCMDDVMFYAVGVINTSYLHILENFIYTTTKQTLI